MGGIIRAREKDRESEKGRAEAALEANAALGQRHRHIMARHDG
jgi:hypothetical protein